MKTQRKKLIAVIILLVIAILVVLLIFKPSEVGSDSAQSTNKQLASTSSQPSISPDLSVYKTDPKWKWWNEQRSSDPDFEWKMPIVFYGKVVDENGKAVPEAKIAFMWTDMSAKGSSTTDTRSNSSGLFELSGVRGKLLQVRATKEGYYSSEDNPLGFEYAAFFEPHYHQPDSNNPVVFRLRKAGEISEDILVRETMMSINPNGTPSFIDLQTTRKANGSNAHIAIRINRSNPNEQKRYTWSASIEGINKSGLIESTDEFMFEAPQSGYKEKYEYEYAENSQNWKSKMKKNYYVTGNEGKLFGRIEVEFIPRYQNTAAISVRFFMNSTGSRNLEYDPGKALPR
jgi:hypothetical protein